MHASKCIVVRQGKGNRQTAKRCVISYHSSERAAIAYYAAQLVTHGGFGLSLDIMVRLARVGSPKALSAKADEQRTYYEHDGWVYTSSG